MYIIIQIVSSFCVCTVDLTSTEETNFIHCRRISAEGIAGKCLKLSNLFGAERLKGSGLNGLAADAAPHQQVAARSLTWLATYMYAGEDDQTL